ncbi:hypothetical protein GVN24_26730 [Rhizobium sp. CRIBSB]|nr:hypothetical protein [Rhizobium sp. CRIBSB]
MKRTAVIAMGLVTLAACGQRTETSAPTASASAPDRAVVTTPVAAQMPIAPVASDLARVCRAGLAAIHEQAVDALAVDSLEGGVASLSWPAPVDGGRMRAQCRLEGDRIVWKPLDRPVSEQNRWMIAPSDPIVRATVAGDRITISSMASEMRATTTSFTLPAERG